MSEYYILVDPSGHYRPITATYYAEHPLEMHDNKIVDKATNYVDACYVAGILNTAAEVMES